MKDMKAKDLVTLIGQAAAESERCIPKDTTFNPYTGTVVVTLVSGRVLRFELFWDGLDPFRNDIPVYAFNLEIFGSRWKKKRDIEGYFPLVNFASEKQLYTLLYSYCTKF